MRLLTFTQVARDFLNVSLPTARIIRDQLPGAVLVSRRVRYREEAITDFVRQGGLLAQAKISA
jgi:hypothetical protein